MWKKLEVKGFRLFSHQEYTPYKVTERLVARAYDCTYIIQIYIQMLNENCNIGVYIKEAQVLDENMQHTQLYMPCPITLHWICAVGLLEFTWDVPKDLMTGCSLLLICWAMNLLTSMKTCILVYKIYFFS